MSTLITIIKEHISYRSQIVRLARADLIKTYRGAALGWFWAIIKPAVTIFVYWFAFEIGLRVSGMVDNYPFFLWLIAGILPWFYMSDMITLGTDCVRKNSHLVTKMKFPVSVIPTFTNVSKMIIEFLLIIITMIIFLAMGYPLTIYMIQLPIYIILMFVFFNCWALFASFIAAMSKDFSNLVKSFVTAVFWLSGVIWNVDNIHSRALKLFLDINPVTYITTGFRNCFLGQKWFFQEPKGMIAFLIITVIMLILGLWSYKKLYKEIPDVL
ncbi:MAG: ABC transporter permease [Oscillospiraceae bacterium]|nr:ABC transporter permease [Oscillospiraceae bacterium]